MVSFTKLALVVSAGYVTASTMAKATVIARNGTDCMTGYGAYSLEELFLWDEEGSWDSLSEEIIIGDACVPDSITTKLYDEMTSRGNALLASGADALSLPNQTGTQLAKRIRNCPDIKEAALSQVSAFSCDSAPNPQKCRNCENGATFCLVSACVSCAAKVNQESLPCCITAGGVFVTYVMHMSQLELKSDTSYI